MIEDDDYTPIPYEPSQICERIEEMLHALQWSWADLAKKSGVSERTFHRWRNGETVPQTGGVRGAAEAMGLTYEEITHALRRRSIAPEPLAPAPARGPRNAYDPWKTAGDDVFVGREATLRALAQALDERRSVNLVGDRRIGKSSILRVWERRARSLGYTVASTSGEMTSGRSARALVKAIARVDADDDADGAADALLAWIRARRRGGAPPLIVVDEFDDLCEHVDPRFFQRLRGMVGEELLVLLLATRAPLAEIAPEGRASSFDNVLATEPVGLLDPGAAEALLALRPDTFSPEERAELRVWSGRHPFYWKLLAHHLIRARREGEPVRKAVDDFLADAGRELQKLWVGHLDARERQALRGIVRGVAMPPAVNRRLCRRGLLTEAGQPFATVLSHWLGELEEEGASDVT